MNENNNLIKRSKHIAWGTIIISILVALIVLSVLFCAVFAIINMLYAAKLMLAAACVIMLPAVILIVICWRMADEYEVNVGKNQQKSQKSVTVKPKPRKKGKSDE